MANRYLLAIKCRLSGIVATITILCIILFGAPVIGKLPMAALTGVMIMLAVGTFEWASFRMINKMPKQDIFVGILVALVIIFLHNLALTFLIGVIISALVFAWESAKRIRAREYLDNNGLKHYGIDGPLLLASVSGFNESLISLMTPHMSLLTSRIVG